jgi:hypothetical protein
VRQVGGAPGAAHDAEDRGAGGAFERGDAPADVTASDDQPQWVATSFLAASMLRVNSSTGMPTYP